MANIAEISLELNLKVVKNPFFLSLREQAGTVKHLQQETGIRQSQKARDDGQGAGSLLHCH